MLLCKRAYNITQPKQKKKERKKIVYERVHLFSISAFNEIIARRWENYYAFSNDTRSERRNSCVRAKAGKCYEIVHNERSLDSNSHRRIFLESVKTNAWLECATSNYTVRYSVHASRSFLDASTSCSCAEIYACFFATAMLDRLNE